MKPIVRFYSSDAQQDVVLEKQEVPSESGRGVSERWVISARGESGASVKLDLQDLLALANGQEPGLIEGLLAALPEPTANAPTQLDPAFAFQQLRAVNEQIQATVFGAMRSARTSDDAGAVWGVWRDAYNHVFSGGLALKATELRNAAGLSFDYFDPDTSYEEDVRAYADALNECVKQNASRFEPQQDSSDAKTPSARRPRF